MAIRTKEEILNAVNVRIGDDTSDEALTFLADLTDTITDLEKKANNDNENWRKKYEENDNAWRKKYRDRFFSNNPTEDDDSFIRDEPKNYTFENLFKEG